MRVDVQKCLVVGPMSSKDAFFAKMQEFGVAEFLGRKGSGLEMPHEVQNLIDALHILRQMVPVKQAGTSDYKSAHRLAAVAIEHNEKLEQLKERHRVLVKEIERVEPFGNFSIPSLKHLEEESGLHFQFFFGKGDAKQEVPEDLIYLSHNLGLNYYVCIHKEKKEFPGFTGMVVSQSVNEIREELAEVNREIDVLEVELSALCHQKKLLKHGLIDALNRYHLDEAGTTADGLLNEQAFGVEAWIPKNKLDLVQSACDELHLVLEKIAIEKTDRQPTYLENKGAARLGEDLVDIYDTPSTTDRDPSAWVFFSFATFFSMIVADAGYGLLILCLSSWLWWKFGKKGGAILRVVKLAFWLSIGCIFWGVMLTSFFGIPISPNNPMRKVSVIDWAVERKAEFLMKDKETDIYQEIVKSYPQLDTITNPRAFLTTVKKKTDTGESYVVYDKFTDAILIELSIFIGVIHLMISFARYLDRAWAGVGWICCLIGGYLFFPTILKATSFIYYIFMVPMEGSPQIGLYMLYGGLGLAVVLSVIQNKLAGLEEFMNVIQVFADVMSYLRIYALSLAGMIMGMTFDVIGTSMPLYVGVFVLLAGHTINFTLAMMGGVIHGLRLNFIEWYHYSFDGGGRKFKPLTLLKLN